MKLSAIIVSLALGLGLAAPAHSAAEVKEVCKDVVGKDGKPVKDSKGNPVQKCNKVKVHKKVEGEKVPDGKKK
jgi:hypothetical protein